jgi:hypothetical protein
MTTDSPDFLLSFSLFLCSPILLSFFSSQVFQPPKGRSRVSRATSGEIRSATSADGGDGVVAHNQENKRAKRVARGSDQVGE